MIISHRFLINKLAREIYPKNNEISRFRTKRRQRLVGRFQPYRNYNEMGLSSITNLKKDLPINMMDDHRSSDRMSIFYKEKAEELEKRRENPYQRDYFKFQRDHQVPYRLGHEDNEELLYNKFNKNWEKQKKFNLMAFELNNFFDDQSLLEIAQPESFIGHFDAIVETQRTLKRRHNKLRHLFIRNKRRYEKWDTIWFNEKFIQPVNAFSGITIPHRLKFRATARARYENRKNKSVFEKFLITKKMSLARGWRSPWNIKFNRKRYKINTKQKEWKNKNEKNKPHIIMFPTRGKVRYHSYFEAVEEKRWAVEQVDYMNFYNQFGSDAMFSSLYANNFWIYSKIRVLKNLEQFLFYTDTRPYKFPTRTLLPIKINRSQDINDYGNSFTWTQTLWMTSFTMLAAGIKVLMATFGLTPIRDVRACFIDQIQTILNLRIVIRDIVFKNFLQNGAKYNRKSVWADIRFLDHVLNEWFNIDLHPFSQFIGKMGLHNIKEAILLDPIELKEKDANNKPLMIYPEHELGVDAYKMAMDYLFTFYGKKALPNHGSYIVNNIFHFENIPFIFSASGCHIASCIKQYVKVGHKGFRIFFKNYNKVGVIPRMRDMLQKSIVVNINHQNDDIIFDKNIFVTNNKLNIYERKKKTILSVFSNKYKKYSLRKISYIFNMNKKSKTRLNKFFKICKIKKNLAFNFIKRLRKKNYHFKHKNRITKTLKKNINKKYRNASIR
jgi:hypothetical protein